MVALFAASLATAPGTAATAFFYGRDPPVELLAAYGAAVVQPGTLDAPALARLRRTTKVYAYLSVGEAGPGEEVPAAWVLARNTGWGSSILDPAAPGLRERLLEKARALAGYDGLFLDTLDAFQAAPATEAQRAARTAAMAALVLALHAAAPGQPLLWNRGFELLPAAHAAAAGVVAESLFARWDAVAKAYVQVPPADREWLTARLREAKQAYGLPITVVDYLPASRREEAREVARKILALGFSPWVGPARLDAMGLGPVEAMPRRVLALWDSGESGSLVESPSHRFLALPLEYLGYAVDYADVAAPLPSAATGRYAGVVAWFYGEERPGSAALSRWVEDLVDASVPVAFFGRLGFAPSPGLLAKLGLEPAEAPALPLTLGKTDELIGFEAPAKARERDPPTLRATRAVSHLRLLDQHQSPRDAVVTGPWGGLVLSPYALAVGYRERLRWVVDPFAFLTLALRLPGLPAPDASTVNGRRILTAHIDGDGFANRAEMPGTPTAASNIYRRILRNQRLPTTVSVVEAEVAPWGLSPRDSPQLEALARSMFALPWVELASHSYSHPFFWARAERGEEQGARLVLPGYSFDVRREVVGSVEYINRRLAPAGKKVEVFLWSGDALPGKEALALVDSLGLANLNGGNTEETAENPSITEVSPLGRPVGGSFQVFAPATNEAVFGTEWRSPSFGYRRALETFQLTGEPRRLKPISIYYHFYSGTKLAALTALEEVYRWAKAQPVAPLFVSEYSRKVREFEQVRIARGLDGAWYLSGCKELRSLRLGVGAEPPDLASSVDVIGWSDAPQGRYVHLGGAGEAVLRLAPPRKPVLLAGPGGAAAAPARDAQAPYLRWANAEVARFARAGRGVQFRLRGHLPVEVAFALPPGARCEARAGGRKVPAGQREDELILRFPGEDTGDATLACR